MVYKFADYEFMEKIREYELFFKENYLRLYYFAFQMIGEKEPCRDIISEALEQTWLHFSQTDKEIKLTSFTYSIVRNKCIDYIRHEAVKAKYIDFYMSMHNESGEDNSYEEKEQKIRLIYSMIAELPPRTQTVLEMCYFQNKTYSEVAEELGVSVSAVRKHIVKALKTFRAGFAKKLN